MINALKCESVMEMKQPENQNAKDFTIEHGVLKRYNGTASAVQIPEGIHTVGYAAFRGHKYLTEVTIPEGVRKIDSLAFAGCQQLNTVHLPDGLAEIGYSAFEGCTALSRIALPEGLHNIDRMVFLGCVNLAEISFPDSLSIVGRDALRDTAWLSNQPDGVIYAGRLALFARGNITEADIKPGTVKICVDAFRNCTALNRITLPDSLEIIEDRAFQNCRKLTQIVIPEAVKQIGYRAFDECIRLSVQMDARAVQIGRQCFMDTAQMRITRMNPAKLPDNMRHSATLAFADDVCNDVKLESSFYESFLKYICSRRKLLYPLALEYWNLLQLMMQERVIPLDDVDLILDSMLGGEQAEAVAALMQYKQSLSDDGDRADDVLDSWDDFELGWDLPAAEKTVEDLEKEWGTKKRNDGTYTLMLYRGSDLELTVPNRIGDQMITAISPSALSPDRHGIKRETADHRRSIRTVTVQEGITKIGNHAFADCDNLMQLTLPESIIEIGYEAFRNCTALTELTLPQSVERIGRGAFAGCVNLTVIQIPEGVIIEAGAFAGCKGGLTL